MGKRPNQIKPKPIALTGDEIVHVSNSETDNESFGLPLSDIITLVSVPPHAPSHVDGSDDIQPANTSQKGLLGSTDWNTFNNKEPAIATSTVGKFWNGLKSFVQVAYSDLTGIPSTFAPSSHASSHTDGTDDIQDATNSQKGLATASQITVLESAEQTVNKNVNNGYAPLDGSALVPLANLPDSVKTGSEYKASYNATTNSPTIIDGTGTNGDYYRVSVAGTQDFGAGNITFSIGDLVIYNGTTTVWEKVAGNPDLVISVAGKQGVVTLDAADITDFDTEVANNTAVTANTAKTTNATHTGEVTGSGVLTVDKTAITNKSLVTISGADELLFADSSDGGNLKRGLASDLLGGGTSNADLISGVITGMDVTVNVDPAKFDISSGTGIVMDWSSGSLVETEITFAGATAVSITAGIGTGIFTTLRVDSSGVIQQSTGTQTTPQQYRQNIVLDTLVHTNLTSITSISRSAVPAFQSGNGFYDYIRALGAINSDNGYSANASNLVVQKAAGTTTLPWINADVDAQNPTIQTNSVQSPLTSGTTSEQYQDGSGGFTTVPGFTAIDPDEYDDGSGTLAAVSNNKWTIRRFYFFGQTDGTLITYGQAQYNSLAEAESSIFSENPNVFPPVSAGTFRTVLIVKKGATDLSDISEAKFVDIVSMTTSAASAAGVQDLQNTYDLSSDPEIITDSTRGALTIQRGSAADTDNIIEGKNGAGTTTFYVKGNGQLNIADGNLGYFLGGIKFLSFGSSATNVYIGQNSGTANMAGSSNNVSIGNSTLQLNMTGDSNIAIGNQALQNETNSNNIGIGTQAGKTMTTGDSLVAIGHTSLNLVTDGDVVGLGFRAGTGVTAGVRSVFLGYQAGSNTIGQLITAENTIVIGANAHSLASNQCVIGDNTNGAEISETYIGGGVEVTTGFNYSHKYRTSNVAAGQTNQANTGHLSVSPGVGSGTGTGASFKVETAPAGTSGTAQNALVTALEVDASKVAGETRFLIYDVDNGTLERVTVGAADSGGVGFKVLRIPN